MRRSGLAAVILLVFALGAQAEHKEIEYLLSELANSNCEFWRNGKTYTAEKASKHLRMKYKRANKYIKTFDEDPEVFVLNGRYGPYIKFGKKNVKIPKGVEPEDLTIEECERLFEENKNKPKRKGRKK